MRDAVEELTVSDTPFLPYQPSTSRPQVARVAEAGTIGGDRSRPKVRAQPLADLIRRKQIQPSFLDPCAAFKDITLGCLAEQGVQISDGEEALLGAPEQKILGDGGFVWLAIAGQEAAGCVALLKRSGVDAAEAFGGPEGATAWELARLAVRREERRQGVATLLVESLLRQFGEVARPGDVLYLEQPRSQETALAFFERVGFEEVPFNEVLAPNAEASPPPDLRMVYRGKIAQRAREPA